MDNGLNQNQETSKQCPTLHHQSLTSLSALSSQAFQQRTSSPPRTLPPLQSQYAVPSLSQPIPGQYSRPQTPRTPNTPVPLSAPSHSGGFPYIAPQPPPTGVGQPQAPFRRTTQPIQGHQTTSSSSTGQHSLQSLASRSSQPQLPHLQPMPAGGFDSPSYQSSFPPISLLPEPSPLPNAQSPTNLSNGHGLETQPAHVVGSQGRRGILPSDPDREPPAIGGSGNATKTVSIPPKDAQGKYPCPHCNKTYLHAKHLKRHLLRHTGERPYMCILCRDTFSRSDILKRHFQKCSLRRGNPTGASHLSLSSAHMKKSHPGPHKPPSSNTPSQVDANLSSANGGGAFGTTSFTPARGVVGDITRQNVTIFNDLEPDQARMLGNDSSKRLANSGGKVERALTGLDSSGSDPRTLASSNSNASHAVTSATGNSGAGFSMSPSAQYPECYTYDTGAQPPTFGGPHPNQASELDWSTFYMPNSSVGYSNSPMFSSQHASAQIPIKAEGNLQNGSFGSLDGQQSQLLDGLYATPMTLGADGLPNTFSHWNLDLSQIDPLQAKTELLIRFCLFDGEDQNHNQLNEEISKLLTVDNVKHFMERYESFQGHWPIIHMATFNPLEAYDGLVMAIVCIGAVYSDRPTGTQVQGLIERSRSAIQREFDPGHDIFGSRQIDIDQLQALTLLQLVSIWHGDSGHRKSARDDFTTTSILARRAGLLKPVEPMNPAYSVLHQPGVTDDLPMEQWSWHSWIEQEKRSRLMFIILLLDAALVIYYNLPPKFNTFEVRLPLPADDAAWDARSSTECADALGFNGPEAQSKNITGSRLKKQPATHHALKTMLEPAYTFHPRTTNVYSKFILIHALHVHIFNAQRQAIFGNGNFDGGMMGSGTNTPIARNEWVSVDQNIIGAPTNDLNTSDDSAQTPDGPSRLLNIMDQALQKWKAAWDEDMQEQYPPSASAYRRFGFCRDGVHFYWLAKVFLLSKRASDWQATADSRFMQVMQLLKKVKTFVASDNAMRGEEIGSVGDIDESYGVTALTLDMKKLFKPRDVEHDSPVSGVQTNVGSTM